MEFTEQMLDAIEAVKGRRDPKYWDPQCRRYYQEQIVAKKDVKKAEKGQYIYKSFFKLLWLL